MSASKQPAVGIDLGTTFSVVSYLDERRMPQTVLNAEGERTTPSAVLFDGTDTIVGREALKAVSSDGTNVALCAKRELGSPVFSKQIGGRKYPPEVIEAFVLNKLRKDSIIHLGEFNQAVITVPAYFDEIRRKATQDAGHMAGFEVLDIINEPTAAALAYAAATGFKNDRKNSSQPIHLAVYDLGGGTFDVTVMRIQGDDFITLATDGDVRLGGQDWDERLVDFAASEFLQEFSIDPRGDMASAGRLWRECEDAKRSLSARNKIAININHHGHHLAVNIKRLQFEQLTRDLLDRTRFTTQQTIQAAGLDWQNIDRVLLVGGSTRMPMVLNMLQNLTSTVIDTSLSADEAVAHGAALRAGVLQDQGNDKPRFNISNVNSHSLGVVGTEKATGRKQTGIVIPRNTKLPVAAKRTFQTGRDAQERLLLEVVEGESPSPEDCAKIGECIAKDLPKDLSAGSKIEVRFVYEENGRLNIAVKLEDGKKVLSHELHRENSLTESQLEAWRGFITGESDN